MDLLSYVRSAVSKDKIRFRDGQYDLDLTYITDNVIAMGFPASGVEATYRNDISHVAEMLNARHFNHYMIWNLSQRHYDYKLFYDMIQCLGWPDHHAPSLSLLFKIVSAMDSWLKADKKNVAVVHCMAGKGRTGTVICSYLLYCGEFDDPLRAISFFGRRRSAIEAGVEQPSQQRYVGYFHEVINGFFPRPVTRRLKRLVLRPVPSFSHLNGIRPVLHIFNTTNYPETLIYTNAPVPDVDIRHYAPYEGKVDFLFRVPIKVKGDILIRLYHISSRFGGSMTATVPVLRAQFNTAFVDGDILVFTKHELDLAYKDKRVHHAFEMRIYFETDNGEEEDDSEDEYWTSAAHNNFMAVAHKNKEKRKALAARNVHNSPNEQQYSLNESMGNRWIRLGEENEEDEEEEQSDPGEDEEEFLTGTTNHPLASGRELDLTSIDSRRNSDVRIGLRDSPRHNTPTSPRRLRTNSDGKSNKSGTDNSLRRSSASNYAPRKDSRPLETKVDLALEDLLKVTEELGNSDLLRECDSENVDISWKDDDSDDNGTEEASALREKDARRSEGIAILSGPSTIQGRTAEGTFGSLTEDLSDFEFLYSNMAGSLSTPVSPSSVASPAFQSRRSVLTQQLLE